VRIENTTQERVANTTQEKTSYWAVTLFEKFLYEVVLLVVQRGAAEVGKA
jgi:hypothetical protein